MRLLCLILLVIGLDVTRASAAKIYLDRDEIVLKGEIKFGDSQKFKKIVDQIYRKSYLQPIDGVTQRDRSSPRNIKRIRLTSIGGRVGEALEIGHYIRTHNVATYVPKGKCYSACALLWLAGRSKFRHPASSIGFHRTFDRKTGRAMGNAIVGFYLSEMGYSYDTARFVTKASPKRLTYLTEQNKSEAGITYQTKIISSLAAAPVYIGTPKFRKDYENIKPVDATIWIASSQFMRIQNVERYIANARKKLRADQVPNWLVQGRVSPHDRLEVQYRVISQHPRSVGAVNVCSAIRTAQHTCNVKSINESEIKDAKSIWW